MSYEPAPVALMASGKALCSHGPSRCTVEYKHENDAYEVVKAFTTYLQSHPEELKRFCDEVLVPIVVQGEDNEVGVWDAETGSEELDRGEQVWGLYRIPNSGGQSK